MSPTSTSTSTLATSILTTAFLAGLALVPSAHAANACDALYNAGIKSIQTPHHVYSATTMHGGTPHTGEAIYDGTAEYLQIRGKWMRSPMPQAAMVAAAQEKLKTHPDTCTPVGDQVIDGQAVSVYTAHNNELGTNQTVRIFKSNGLMQGGTVALPGGNTIETRYEYTNVQTPAGVQ
ncbi:MAG: hypothetical protein ABI870_10700 [Rhodanobacter sp.]